MIKKLKIKFIILSMTSLFVLLSVIVVGMNIINYTSIIVEADEILELMSKNKGTFPGFEEGAPSLDPMWPDRPEKEPGGRLPQSMSPEVPYESRYFSVLVDADGKTLYTDVRRIASVDEASAANYASRAMSDNGERGSAGDYRYVKTPEGENTRITFLDLGRKLDSFRGFLLTSVMIALAGFAAVSIVIIFLSGRIIRPIAESYEKQKRFITDAGHEMKTPLTIINANADILESELPRNESLSDIRQQAKRLTELTNDLVYLARMEESEKELTMIELPLSETVLDTAEEWRSLAVSEGKRFCLDVQPMLSVKGNARALAELVTILMDNAIKYSPKGGEIKLVLEKQSRAAILTVTNTATISLSEKEISRVFDRFFRADASRNSETGGHGIGLSIAKAIANAHGGKISASMDGDDLFKVTVVLPM